MGDLLIFLPVLVGCFSLGSVGAWVIARGYEGKSMYPWNWRVLIWPTVYLNWLDNKEDET